MMPKSFVLKIALIFMMIVGFASPSRAGCESRNPLSPNGCDGWCWRVTNDCGTVTNVHTQVDIVYNESTGITTTTTTITTTIFCECLPTGPIPPVIPPVNIVIPLPGIGGEKIDFDIDFPW